MVNLNGFIQKWSWTLYRWEIARCVCMRLCFGFYIIFYDISHIALFRLLYLVKSTSEQKKMFNYEQCLLPAKTTSILNLFFFGFIITWVVKTLESSKVISVYQNGVNSINNELTNKFISLNTTYKKTIEIMSLDLVFVLMIFNVIYGLMNIRCYHCSYSKWFYLKNWKWFKFRWWWHVI